MEAILQNLEQFAEVLSVARSEHVRSWDRQTTQRAFQWAGYFQHVHRRFHAPGPVRAALEERLRGLSRLQEAGARPLRFQELGSGAELLWESLLRNPSLRPSTCHYLMAGLKQEGSGELPSDSLCRAARQKTASRLLLSLSSDFVGKTEAPSCFGGEIEQPPCLGRKTKLPSCSDKKTEWPSSSDKKTEWPSSSDKKTEWPPSSVKKTEPPPCSDKKTEWPSCSSKKTQPPSCSDRKTELPRSFGGKTMSASHYNFPIRSSTFGEKTEPPLSFGGKSERLSCFIDGKIELSMHFSRKAMPPFSFSADYHNLPFSASNDNANPTFCFSERQRLPPFYVPNLTLDPVIKTQASLLAKHLEDRTKDPVTSEGDKLVMVAEVLAQVPKPRVFRLMAVLLASSDCFVSASLLPKLLLQWLFGEPSLVPYFCSSVDCDLLTDLASKYPGFRKAYLDLLSSWGRSMEYDIVSGQWSSASPDVSWAGLHHHFRWLLIGSSDTREAAECTLRTLKAEDGDFDVRCISVWTDLLLYLMSV